MGIRFNTNTWRTPLLLIDCWLPAQTQPRDATRTSLSNVVQRFTRAGWLGYRSTPKPSTAEPVGITKPGVLHSVCHVRVLRTAEAIGGRRCNDARLVISGRMSDVCAELDRLAALEQSIGPASA